MLDYGSYFLKRWVLRLDLQSLDIDTTHIGRARKFQTVELEKGEHLVNFLCDV